MRQTTSAKLASLGLAFALPLGIFLWTWWSPVTRYRVAYREWSPSEVSTARTAPGVEVFKSLSELRFDRPPWTTRAELLEAADNALLGKIQLRGLPEGSFHLPFAVSDISSGPPSIQLANASLLMAQLFLDAYAATGDERYFKAAEQLIAGWAGYERRAWLPRGFLWNDHAIAARIHVLTDFWSTYRARADFNPALGAEFLEFVERSGVLLARPENFTVTTNHGVMENLALLEICIAFPDLPKASEWRQTALSRLKTQFSFYVTDEGVILEHSAGYHAFGLHLMVILSRYLELLHETMPADWKRKLELAGDFYNRIRRPDGTLPMFGDTDGKPDLTGRQPSWRIGQASPAPDPPQAPGLDLYPVSGYAVWHDDSRAKPGAGISQTVVGWSYFSGFGHKHADEPSINFWANGQAWWNGVGYWSYDDPYRRKAESWEGSNAPHLVGEPATSSRKSELLFSAWAPEFAALDIERSGIADYVVRRQVLRIGPQLWLVLDSSHGGGTGTTEIIWNSAANVRTAEGNLPGSYRLTADEGKRGTLHLIFVGSDEPVPKLRRGSLDPFGGWQVIEERARPAPAIALRLPASESWLATLWFVPQTPDAASPWTARPSMKFYENPDRWSMQVPLTAQTLNVTRQDRHFRVDVNGENKPLADLYLIPAHRDQVQVRREAYLEDHSEALALYPRVRELIDYRVRVTVAIAALLLAQAVVGILVFLKRRQKATLAFLTLSVGWAALWLWLAQVYLPA